MYSRLKVPNCYCAAYVFPHRPGSGKCDAGVNYSYRSHVGGKPTDEKFSITDVCEACGLAADSHEEDFGIGSYEFWGAPGCDVDIQEVSDCCSAPMVANTFANNRIFKWNKITHRSTSGSP